MQPLYTKYRNFILFTAIGCVATLVDFGLYSLLHYANFHYLVANIISYHVGIVCSFLLNRHYNFKMKDKTVSRFCSFYIINLAGLILSEVLLFLFVDRLQWNSLLSKLIATVFVGILLFVGIKYYTFKKPKQDTP